MSRTGVRKSSRSTRQPTRSPGRPPVGRREDRVQFWAAIARGLFPVAAVASARVSWVVGARWFRQAGGMPRTQFASTAQPLVGRFLCFAEREQLALLRVQGHGVRECARQLHRAPSRELRRNASTRSGALDYRATTAQWHADRAARRPKRRNWRHRCPCGSMCRTDWQASSPRRPVRSRTARRYRGKAVGTGHAKTGGGLALGARSRSHTGSCSTSRTTSPCVSSTKPSIRRCMSKVAEHYDKNSPHVCEPVARCACLAPELAAPASASCRRSC